MDLLADLEARGLIAQCTDRGALAARLAEGPLTLYCGFDPTADSLHVGHLLGQMTLRRFQLAGHRPIALAGGATGMVGDPSGRSEERNLLDAEALAANVEAIRGQLERLLDFEAGALLVNNADWTASVGVLEFLRDVGKHVTVNHMVAKESVRARMQSEDGISFTEFSYMLLQANDFVWLRGQEGCELQVGGSDQWGNITLGIDMVRRRLGLGAFGLTWPLLTKADGEKFGKTASGAVWLAPERTSPYQFRQFWVQAPDDQVERLLLQFTLLPVEEVRALVAEHLEAPERRAAQRRLAQEMTSLVHGEGAAASAEAAAEALFGRSADPAALTPEVLAVLAGELGVTEVAPDDPLERAAVAAGLGTSLSDVRRAGLRVNGEPQADLGLTVGSLPALPGGHLLLRRGARSHALLRLRAI